MGNVENRCVGGMCVYYGIHIFTFAVENGVHAKSSDGRPFTFNHPAKHIGDYNIFRFYYTVRNGGWCYTTKPNSRSHTLMFPPRAVSQTVWPLLPDQFKTSLHIFSIAMVPQHV